MLKFENPHNGRYYYLMIERDLLNDFVLVIRRGGHHHHVICKHGFDSENDLQKEIKRLSLRRLAHGYVLTPQIMQTGLQAT